MLGCPKHGIQTNRDTDFLQAVAVLSLILRCRIADDFASLLVSGIPAMVIRLSPISDFVEEGLTGLFLGEYSWHNWWGYFPVAFLIKTPVGSLVLIAISLVFYRAGKSTRIPQALFLVLPVILIFLPMTQAKTNIGLRHILPVYPFLFVLASRMATFRFHRSLLAPLLIGIPLTWTAISSLRVVPHQLAYFNESVGGPEQGYRYLSDSNLDWGHRSKRTEGIRGQRKSCRLSYLSYFGTAPPSYYGIRYQDVASKGTLRRPCLRRSRPMHRARSLRSAFTTCKTFQTPQIRCSAGSGCASRSPR